MDTVLIEMPSRVSLERLDAARPVVLGRRVWVPNVSEFGTTWAGDYRLASDIWLDRLDGRHYVRVCDEGSWYSWVAHNTDPETGLVRRDAWPRSTPWPIDLLRVEGSAR